MDNLNNFHYVSVLLDSLYGVEMDDEDVEELGLIAWGLIGNKRIRLYKTLLCIDPTDNSITLPCNMIEEGGCVELVTGVLEDWEDTTNYSYQGNPYSFYVEQSIESEKRFQSPWYLPGKTLKYHLVGDKLYFTHNYGRVNILYKGYLVDEDGLPQLTDKEATAIATYLAYVSKFKESLKTNNTDITKMAVTLKQLWALLCDLARMTYLNLNDMEQVLEVASSWDRKAYGKSHKIIR